MSKPTRWILGIVLILLGLAAEVFAIFGGAFSSIIYLIAFIGGIGQMC